MKRLKGKKTYIVAAIMVVLSGLKAQGLIDETLYNSVFNILVAGGLVALRMGMNK